MHRPNPGCGQWKSRGPAASDCQKNASLLAPKLLSSFGTPNCCLQVSLPRCRAAALPTRRNSGGHHHLDYFRKKEPVKAPAKGLCDGMRQNSEPGEASGEEYNFAEKSGHGGAS